MQALPDLRRATSSVPAEAKSKGFRPDIQGLRAVAVVAVILDHFVGWPTGGFVGVDVFFVISGFLITGLLLKEHARTGTISFKQFYLRRVKRILPAAVLVAIATVAASYFLFSTQRFTATLWDGIWATLFSANWRFALLGTDYFESGGPVSPLQHYWSLSVEEQYYFVWPWVMLLVFVLVGRKANASPNAGRNVVGVLLAVITVASFVWSVWETSTNPSWAYFSTASRTWELGAGALLAVYAPALSRIPLLVQRLASWGGITTIVVSMFLVSAENSFPGPAAAAPVIGAALIILGGMGGDRATLSILTNPASRYIGDISYSLYLWHFPVAILLLSFYLQGSAEYLIVGSAAMLLLSVLSYHFLEDPIRKSSWPGKSRRRKPRIGKEALSLVGLGALAVTTAVVVTMAFVQQSPDSATATQSGTLAAPDVSPSSTATVPGCWGAASLDPAAACNRELGSDLLPAAKTVGEDTGNSYSCFPKVGDAMKSCTYGGGSTRVAVIGDSHAASLLPGLSEQAERMGWTLDTYVGVGCILQTDSCAGMDAIQARLLENPYDIVVTSAYRGSGKADQAAHARAYANAFTPIAQAGSKIVVVKDVPMSTGPIIECVQRIGFDPTQDNCAIDKAMAFKVDDAVAMASEMVPNSGVVDTEPYFCNTSECPGVIGNVIVYRDDVAHISATYSKTLGPYLARDIATVAAAIAN